MCPEHAVERGSDKFVVVRSINVVGTNPIEHLAEQTECLVSVTCGCYGAHSNRHHARLGDENCEARADKRSHEEKGLVHVTQMRVSPMPSGR